MGLLSFLGFKQKSAATASYVGWGGGWGSSGLWGEIREAFSGDWQKNIEHNRLSVLHYSPVFSCITLIAGDVSKLEWVIDVEDAKSEIWVRAPKTKATPYINVLRNPNNYQNHIQFKECWILSKLTNGNTYVLLGRDSAGRVNKMYILNPYRVTPLVDEDGQIWYQLSKDNLTGGLMGESVVVPASEIIHDRFNCLFHPLIGLSPIFACALPALQGIKVQENYYTFFKNGARPSGILTAPGNIDKATAVKLKAQFDEGFTAENAGRTAVLGDGLKYERVTMSALDAQVIDQMKMNTEQICSVFHVPQYKIGVGAVPAFQNIESLAQDYYSTCLQKHIEDMELAIDQGLSIKDETYAHLDLDGLLRMDQASLVTSMSDAVKGTLMAPNEGRKKLNLPPVKGGDAPLSQQQNYSLEALAKRDALPDPFIITTPTRTPDPGAAQDPTAPANAPAPAPAPDPNASAKSMDNDQFYEGAFAAFALEMEE